MTPHLLSPSNRESGLVFFVPNGKLLVSLQLLLKDSKTIWRIADNKTETNNPSQMSSNRSILLNVVIMIMTCIVPQPLTLMAQERHALLVGISDYPQYTDNDASWTKIHGVNDVQLIKPILKKQGFRINTLQDKTATYKAITKSLVKLKNEVGEGDIVYLHFSGHGQAVEDENGDEEDGWDEAFIPYDAQRRYKINVYAGEKHLLDDELNEYLNAIREKIGQRGILYVVIDACHAGSSYRGDAVEDSVFVRGTDIGFSKSGKNYAPRIDKRGNIRIKSSAGLSPLYMIEACRSYEVNTEIKQDGKYYGPISYYIFQQLLTQPLSYDIKWIENVRKAMDMDVRLIRQHMVVESSK